MALMVGRPVSSSEVGAEVEVGARRWWSAEAGVARSAAGVAAAEGCEWAADRAGGRCR